MQYALNFKALSKLFLTDKSFIINYIKLVPMKHN